MKEGEGELIISEQSPAIIDDNIVEIAEKAEKRINAVNKIKTMSLKVTNAHDWLNQAGKPYLAVSGAEKIARLFGISWRIDEPKREDEESGHFTYTYKGYFSFSGVTIEAIGTRSSKDGFFKRYSGKGEERVELPPSEIDKSDVKKAAFTNCIGNGITRLLGIRNLTWEELQAAGIKVEGMTKVEYKQTEEAAGAKDIREEIRKMILEMSAGDDNQAKALLQKFTSFIPKGKTEADRVQGKAHIKDLTEKQLQPTYGKIKEAYEKWQKEKPADKPKEGAKMEPQTSDMILAMQNASTPEECDSLLQEAVKGGIKGENYTCLVRERDKRVTVLKGELV